uniref:Zinc finger and BTB domain containing 7C n=1 Tax=Paramormyrops kingsleyae TaxID=1676925 RepID=A0A3B3RVD0_9TELE|nr:zinc finger and BTB domain-containing protein 7C-like [Paramormyrops kingsleyae]XP_023657677.1 zinc finger and BTB domain-containing protein 7C-like [Paramormyrops kingsleyae]XP_023657682.1 zinc finger and BTB domain-containing protein 7C-like [Paramormyrops kingsleyae]XP_023657690.1 zinc finger and BTB domain-containing protein 7C-like [Paramormyrops kingsleyae]
MDSREEDRIGIPFPNHCSDLLCGLNEQRQDGTLCDVVLVVGDHEYRAHRAILAACSQYFKKLFTVGTDDSWHGVYEIDFVDHKPLAAILEFAYTSTLTVTNANVKEVLNAARMLEIPCIISVCQEILDTGGEEDEEEDMESEEEEEASREEEEDSSEKSTPGPEHQSQEVSAREQESPTSTSPGDGLSDEAEDPDPTEVMGEKQEDPKGPENRALKDFSIESLLQEGLYPKLSATDRTPLFPGFFPPMWNPEFPGFPPILEPNSIPLPYCPQRTSMPLDLAVKKEAIKEELQNEVHPNHFHSDFLKDFIRTGLSVDSDTSLGTIKDEGDLSSYLSFLSASQLGAFFPPWPLVEDKKMKPKASQQCPICNKVIQGAGKLPRHMRTHTGEKPYICSICEVRFTRQDKLKIHMRKHTGERPYICLHCNSKFVHNYDLKNHLRIHTGVRPYQCEHCTKSFTRSDHLHRHVKRQSCRVTRPRRGRRPMSRRPSLPLYLHSTPHEDRLCPNGFLPPSHNAAKPSFIDQKLPSALENFDSDDRRSLEAKFLDNNQPGVAERRRGVFAFALARDDILSRPPIYSPAVGHWAMRVEPQATS